MSVRRTDASSELLSHSPTHLAPDILDGSYRLPVSDGSAAIARRCAAALELLTHAGYDLDGTVLRQRATGRRSPSRSW